MLNQNPIRIKRESVRINKPQPKKLRIVRDGKTPTREELLSIIATLIPEAPKTASKREIKKMIEDYIAQSVKTPPSLDFEIKETDLGTEIFINGKKHIIPKAIYGPKLRNLQQMGDVSITNPTNTQALIFRDGYWVNEEAASGGIESIVAGTNTSVDNTDPLNPIVSSTGGAAIGGTVTSGTSGSVLFVNPDAVLAQNNQNFYYNNTLSRLSSYASLGSELLTNGNFTGSATGWTVGSGYAYSSNSVSKTTNGTSALSQTISANKGREHLCTFTISNWTVGTVTVSCGGITGTAVGANGTYTFRFVPTNSNALAFTPTNTARFTIDTVSVKVLTGGEIRTGYMNIDGSWSNGTPGTTRAQSFNNAGSYTWTDYNFSGVLRASMGANSSGGYDMYTSGGNGVAFFNGNSGLTSNSVYSYNYVNYFYHSGNIQAGGYGMFGSSVGAGTGSGTTPTSTLQSAGSTALKVKRLTASGNLDSTASHWLLDATSAAACAGTPSVSACSTYTGSGQATCESHLPCVWYAGSSCDVYNGDQGNCQGTPGCNYDTASCSSFGDETTCNSYSGCSWANTPQSCSGFDEYTCGVTSGCSIDTGYCSWDGTYCTGGGDCTSQMDESSCTSYSYYNGCSGSYDSYSCTGDYYTGTCSGTYGASCSGTVTCSSYGTSGACAAEAGCTWSAVLNAQLPDGDTCPDRTYWLKNDASGGADAIILPYSGQTIEKTTSLTLNNYQDAVHIAYFKQTYDCSNYVTAGTCTPSGCTPNYFTCSWNSEDNTCSGDAVCTGIGDQSTCESTSYFSSCSGTEVISKNWYIF